MTKRWVKLALIAATAIGAHMAYAQDVSGLWVATVPSSTGAGEPQLVHVRLDAHGAKLMGIWGSSAIDGTIEGRTIRAGLVDSEGKSVGSFSGTLAGDTVTGTGTFPRPSRGFGGGFGGGRGGNIAPASTAFTLTRELSVPAKPRDIKFEPKDFYATYSAAAKPALHIFPGDVVRTWTADAGGVDAKGVRHRGGDSNIGPFYVEGALPGDTLAIHLLKVRTNRATARQGTRINAHAVTAAYLVGAKYDPEVTGEWTLLPEKGIAVPTHPSAHMKNYSIPLKPMLGCVSVAPPGDEQYRGSDLGPFGGNMDYNDNVEGTTIYLPVFHAGALLGMGDGHAAMGDGELTGAALETSMDVDFSTEVIRNEAYPQPRAETADYVISFGISGSVPESIQLATSQLATWIKKDYKLTDSEVAILFASTLKYDITELVDAKYNVAAKVPKSILKTMQ